MKYNLAQVLDFLREIKVNNNTEWFHAHKAQYEKARDTFKALSQEILTKMQVIDPLLRGLEVKNCIFRFNRDTRFSADKAPYKRHFGVYLVPGGKKVVGAMARNLNALGFKPRRRLTYRRACQEGWAPAPTNEFQKAVWEQVKADKERGPANPITIPPPNKKK